MDKLNYFILISVILLLCGSCSKDNNMGHISKIGLETFSVVFSEERDTVAVKTKEPSWSIYSIWFEEDKETMRYNNGYIKHFDNGNIVRVLCDTMAYEWLTLLKNTPTELKIIVEDNPLNTARSATVTLLGGVGYFPEDLIVTQKGQLQK